MIPVLEMNLVRCHSQSEAEQELEGLQPWLLRVSPTPVLSPVCAQNFVTARSWLAIAPATRSGIGTHF